MEQLPTSPIPTRLPALTATLMLSAGIVIDRYCGVGFGAWMFSGGLLLILVCAAMYLSGRLQVLYRVWLLAGLLIAVGGMRHHLFWSLRETSSIHALSREATPVRLQGTISSPISIKNNNRPGVPTWMRLDHSIFLLDCESLLTHNQSVTPVSGIVRVDVAGHVLHAEPGDRVEILGQLSLPAPPRNPGDFDYPEYLRMQGIDRLVRSDHPDCVIVVEQPTGVISWPGRLRNRVRDICDELIFEHLPASVRPVALSLLIGDRSDLRDETENAFIRSGTMHILAISGLHIGVLAGFVWFLCRALQIRTRTASVLVLATILGYAAIAESRPPVMRAVVLGGILVLGRATGRQTNGIQSLSLSALALLLYRPSDLFDVGAQLSFVAVAAIILVTPWIAERTQESFTDRLLAGERSWWMRSITWTGRWLLAGYLVTLIVWLVTVPITMRSFHLVAPAGLLVNALITPFSTLVLVAGYLFLGVGLLLPVAAKWVAFPFSWSLSAFLKMVEWSARLPGGYGETPEPALGWMIGFYGLLLGAMMVEAPRIRQWTWRAIPVWTLVWLIAGAWPRGATGELRCTFLDVGHGEAVLVECPNGQTLLYDCGSMGDGRRAARAVQSALRAGDSGRIDAWVISHADADHYNGGIDLVSQTPVGMAWLSRHCLDFEQEGLAELFDELSRHGTEIRLIQTGDRLRVDPNVEIEVLHPTPRIADLHDNANSVVLRITYQGRSILLTGDIEQAGARLLTQTPAMTVDLLMAPHHGGKTANTSAIEEWCRPRNVVASSSRDVNNSLRAVYRRAQTVDSTGASGAIQVRITHDGEMDITPFLKSGPYGMSGHR